MAAHVVIGRFVPRTVTRRCSLQWVIASMSAFFSHEYRGYSDVSRHSNLRAVDPRPLARNLLASCGVKESFTVIAPEQPCLEGCYHSTNTYYQGLTTFTPSGDYYAWPQPLVRLGEHALGNGSSEVEPWWLIRQQSENSSDVYCFSEESAASVHPSNETWICDLFQEGSYRRLDESEFRVTCGCSGDLPQAAWVMESAGQGPSKMDSQSTRVVELASARMARYAAFPGNSCSDSSWAYGSLQEAPTEDVGDAVFGGTNFRFASCRDDHSGAAGRGDIPPHFDVPVVERRFALRELETLYPKQSRQIRPHFPNRVF